MKQIEELLKRIRPALPRFSYSKIDTFKNCPLQYKFKYIENKRTEESTIALDIGNLCHYILEKKGLMVSEGKKIDYDLLNEILISGTKEKDVKTKDDILGVQQLKKKYFDKWYEADNASGLSYEEKINKFSEVVLKEEMENSEWIPKYFEMPFEFIWNDEVIISGFIDRVDVKGEQFKVVDYKTSKKIFDNKVLPTSLQFGIYALAILNRFGVLPEEYEYRFLLINETQYALTKGWEKRLIKALDKVFSEIRACEGKNLFIPKPSPLCHWCSYCATNPDATTYKRECDYYSKWTPESKTFDVNKKWNALEQNNTEKNKRRLVF